MDYTIIYKNGEQILHRQTCKTLKGAMRLAEHVLHTLEAKNKYYSAEIKAAPEISEAAMSGGL